MVRRFGVVAAVALVLMVAATPSTAEIVTPQPPTVHVATQLTAKGRFSGLVSGDGWLYSVDLGQPGYYTRATVVRLNPGSGGHVVARSAVLPFASFLTFVDNTLWLTAGSPNPGLVALNPTTLHIERSVPEHRYLESLTGSGAGPLWATESCKLLRLDPSSGRTLLTVTDHAGTNCSVVTDNQDGKLFVEVEPAALRGHPPTPTLLLQERDASNGRLLASAIIANPSIGYWMSAEDGNLWLSGMDVAAACGFIYEYRASPFRLFASSYGRDCASPPPGSATGPGSLPDTLLFPFVNISGGVVWV